MIPVPVSLSVSVDPSRHTQKELLLSTHANGPMLELLPIPLYSTVRVMRMRMTQRY